LRERPINRRRGHTDLAKRRWAIDVGREIDCPLATLRDLTFNSALRSLLVYAISRRPLNN